MIHPTAIIYPGVTLGPGTFVGPYSILGSEDGSKLTIGAGSVIRSHSVVYGGSAYGDRLETGHYTLLRAHNVAGVNLRIGSYSSLEGNATIGDYVRIHGRYESTGADIRDFARIYGGSYLTDNRRPPSRNNEMPVVCEGAVICMGSVMVAGFTLGRFSYVGASTVIARDVPDGHLLLRDGTIKPLKTFWPEYEKSLIGEYPPEAQARIWALLDSVR